MSATGRGSSLWLLGAGLLLALGVWVNTGTLAPYGATLPKPYVWGPCSYLMNIDHFHFKATFLMLDGAPRDQWGFSVVLRRILYPLLAYPFMKVWGFEGGGLIVNVLLALGSLALFWRALRRRLGTEPPPALLVLLATYPGWFYWTGTPYSYAIIVPASLLCMALLWRVETLTTGREALLAGLGLGVLFTGYDLLPFFGAAAVLLLLWRRLWAPCAALAAAMLLPAVATSVLLWQIYRVPFRNNNTEAYFQVLKSYFSPIDLHAWWALLRQFSYAVKSNYLYSNFLFLPLLFLAVLIASWWLPRDARILRPAEVSLLIAVVLLFLFNNLAPPYPGWPLRGSWVPRLYQPAMAAMVPVLAYFFARAALLPRPLRLGAWAALGLAIALQAWVVFAPVLGDARLSGYIYWRFYEHATRPLYAENLARYGARPVGFCASPPSAQDSTMH
ncbi:MAG TPA: hypothetical protein VII86_14465 [Thermoanaerobaculia bacterium]